MLYRMLREGPTREEPVSFYRELLTMLNRLVESFDYSRLVKSSDHSGLVFAVCDNATMVPELVRDFVLTCNHDVKMTFPCACIRGDLNLNNRMSGLLEGHSIHPNKPCMVPAPTPRAPAPLYLFHRGHNNDYFGSIRVLTQLPSICAAHF